MKAEASLGPREGALHPLPYSYFRSQESRGVCGQSTPVSIS